MCVLMANDRGTVFGQRATTLTHYMKTLRRVLLHSMLCVLAALSLSCSTPQEGENQEPGISGSPAMHTHPKSELTLEQQASFDALNFLQTNTDEMNRLYSTFPNIGQTCHPPDTSYAITRSELLAAMKQFVTRHCTNLSIEKRTELAATAVLAQENYTVIFCSNHSDHPNDENGLPMSGTWVMPGVCGRRDVILIW